MSLDQLIAAIMSTLSNSAGADITVAGWTRFENALRIMLSKQAAPPVEAANEAPVTPEVPANV